MRLGTTIYGVICSLVFGLGGQAAELQWSTYRDADFGYSIDLPLGLFEPTEGDRGLTLVEVDGEGQIDVYGASNAEGLSPREFEATLATADRIREITYARRGASWFVISGYYKREGIEANDLIFYAKFMFSTDRMTISAFEASYSISDKERYDPIIEHMEDSLSVAPSRALPR